MWTSSIWCYWRSRQPSTRRCSPGVLLILTRPNPLRILVTFLVGEMVISVLAGFVLVKALESSGVVSKSNSSSKPIVDIVISAASLLVARGVWSGGRRHRDSAPAERAIPPSCPAASRTALPDPLAPETPARLPESPSVPFFGIERTTLRGPNRVTPKPSASFPQT